MSESFFDKFRKKETVIAAGPSPIWNGVPGQSQPAQSSPFTPSPSVHQQPAPVVSNDFTFQPRPQPLSAGSPAQPRATPVVDTQSERPATVVYPRAVPNNPSGMAPGAVAAQPGTFGPYAAGRTNNQKDDDGESFSSVLHDAEDAYVKTKQLVMEKLGKAQISELPFVKPKLDKLHHTYKEFEQLTEHVKRLWICVRDIRDTQKLFGEFFTEAASMEEEFVKDPLADLASAFTNTHLYGEELYNTLKSLKETTETFYNAAIADANFTASEYEKKRVAYDATRQRVSEMQQDSKTDPVSLRNAQNNLEVKRTDFQQVGADLATKMIILNEKRIQILSERLKEYYQVMRKYYGSCSDTFNRTNRGELHMPIESSFGTVKFKDLIASLRNERESKKSEGEDETEEKENEEIEFTRVDTPPTQASTPTTTTPTTTQAQSQFQQAQQQQFQPQAHTHQQPQAQQQQMYGEQQAAFQVPQQIPQQVSQQIPQQMPHQIPQQVSHQVSQHASQQVPQQAVQAAPQPSAAVQQLFQRAAQPQAQTPPQFGSPALSPTQSQEQIFQAPSPNTIPQPQQQAFGVNLTQEFPTPPANAIPQAHPGFGFQEQQFQQQAFEVPQDPTQAPQDASAEGYGSA